MVNQTSLIVSKNSLSICEKWLEPKNEQGGSMCFMIMKKTIWG